MRSTAVTVPPDDRDHVTEASDSCVRGSDKAGAAGFASERVVRWALRLGHREFPVRGDVCVVGRGQDVDLQLDDTGVSRRHAFIHAQGERLLLQDLGSKNGTFVNGSLVSGVVQLELDDLVAFGPCELRVAASSSPRARRSTSDCTTQRVPRRSSTHEVTASPLSCLSPRERELLPLLASGLSQRELAARLGVTIKTIETYRTRIGHKLGLTSRAGLVRFALDHGLLGAAGES